MRRRGRATAFLAAALLAAVAAGVVADGYGGGERRLRLHGQAFFQVVHDESHPFEVVTDAARVTDVGTSFTVTTIGQDSTRVVVTHGAVNALLAVRRG